MRRALDLATRYDYEYWLRQEISAHSQVFVSEDARDLLPPDLRQELAAAPQVAAVEPIKLPSTVLTSAPVVDLTINMLGPVEIFRDLTRPFAADAWTTRRGRDILCFIASRRHRRSAKDTIIDTFWRDSDLKAVEKNFHPTMSHIRKALNSNQPLKQNFLLYRDGDYQLNPEFSYRLDTEDFDRLIGDGEAARRERKFDRCIESYEKAVATNGSKNSVRIIANNTCECWNRLLRSPKRRRNGRVQWIWRSEFYMPIRSAKTFTAL